MDRDIRKGFLFAFLSAISGAYLFIFAKYVLQSLNPETFCSIYYVFASLYFAAWLVLTGQLRLLRLPAASIRLIFVIAVLESVSVIALFSAVRLMDPTLVSFFNNAQTVFIILLSAVFLKERFTQPELLGTAVALAGILLISFRSARPVVLGMALTLLSAVFFSCTVILVKKSMLLLSPLTLGFYRAVALMVVMNAYALAGGAFQPVESSLVLYISAGALFGPFLNILFYFYSLKYFDASKTSLIRASQPLFVLLNAAVFLQFVPSPKEIAGGLIIILGLYILVTGRERLAGTPPAPSLPGSPGQIQPGDRT